MIFLLRNLRSGKNSYKKYISPFLLGLVAGLLINFSCRTAHAISKPLTGLTFLIDPGHGGSDPGAIGPTGLKESTTNLRVAKYLRMLLQADGATVYMTREDDKYLSLSDRVAIASDVSPDLFISIHHNASLKPRKNNRAEVFYNGLDRGISFMVGKSLAEAFVPSPDEEPTALIPGGFFVLRNNSAPAVLTEASYISIKHIETKLKSGKGLTNEAQAIRMAIRKAFQKPLIQVNIFASRPAYVNTPYFRFIIASNQPIERAQVRITPYQDVNFAFERIPFAGYVYTLYNTKPLNSGKYTLSMQFFGDKESVSRPVRLPIELELPLNDSVLMPVLPYIPKGMSGEFPVLLVLKDALGRINTRSVSFTAHWNGLNIPGITNPDGKAVILLPLTGHEEGRQILEVSIGDEIIARTAVDVSNSYGNVILGKVICGHSRTGLEKVRIKVTDRLVLQTTNGGYFAFEFPAIFRNLLLKFQPPPGYVETEKWIQACSDEPITRACFVIQPKAPSLLGKRVGIMAPRALDQWVRPLVKTLMKAGVKTYRLYYPEGKAHPEYSSVLQANAMGNLDLVFSFKSDPSPVLVMRHYHRGGVAKNIALSAQKILANSSNPLKLLVEAGSDYELGNVGTTCVVIGVPALSPPNTPERLAEAIYRALQAQL